MQNFNKDISLDDVRITQEEFTKLTEAHLQMLEQCGLLETIINLLEAEIKVSLDSIVKYSEHFAQSRSPDSAEYCAIRRTGLISIYLFMFFLVAFQGLLQIVKLATNLTLKGRLSFVLYSYMVFPNSLLPCTFCHNEGTADPLAYGRFPYAFLMF